MSNFNHDSTAVLLILEWSNTKLETEKKDIRKRQSKTMIDDLIQWVELWKEKGDVTY